MSVYPIGIKIKERESCLKIDQLLAILKNVNFETEALLSDVDEVIIKKNPCERKRKEIEKNLEELVFKVGRTIYY